MSNHGMETISAIQWAVSTCHRWFPHIGPKMWWFGTPWRSYDTTVMHLFRLKNVGNSLSLKPSYIHVFTKIQFRQTLWKYMLYLIGKDCLFHPFYIRICKFIRHNLPCYRFFCFLLFFCGLYTTGLLQNLGCFYSTISFLQDSMLSDTSNEC